MTTSCNCTIVPPHMLEEMILRGDEHDREVALNTLLVDSTHRASRQMASATQGAGATRPNKNRRIHDARNQYQLPGALVRSEGQGSNGDVAVDEAHDGLGATHDLLWQVFGRDSMDDAGMSLIGTVHYGSSYNNAAWNGTQMFFGDGDGQYFNRFTAAIDIMGHELAHGVTTNESNLEYQYQSGALNEHLSDVIGSLVKQRTASPQQTAAQADWIIGEGLFTSRVNGVGLRSMKEPGTAYDDDVFGKDPQPGHMDDYVETTSDNGGVHINSGIPNKAFYLVAIGLGGYAWDRAGQIWYATMTDARLTSTAQFVDFAELTVEHANSLYGAAEAAVVTDAWAQVGIDLAGGGGAMVGGWTLHFSWGCTGNYSQVDLTFAANRTFSGGGLSGRWFQEQGTLILVFDNGPARYAGTLAGHVGSGGMSTFAGSDGCWYLTRHGITGVVG